MEDYEFAQQDLDNLIIMDKKYYARRINKYLLIWIPISLVIITYNRYDELDFTLDKLQHQVINFPYQLVIINQNSIDQTEQIVISHKNNFDDLCYIKLDENVGVAEGRNIGVKHSKYDFLVFLDDDAHFVEDDALQKIYNLMINNNNSMFAFHIYDKDNGLYNWPYGRKKLKKSEEDFLCSNYIGCGHALKRLLFNEVGGYSNNLYYGYEETEFIMKAFGRGSLPVLYLSDIKVIHRVSSASRLPVKKKFMYKVRNRLYIIRELHPIRGGFYYLYYLFGYFINAIRFKMVKAYFEGLKESRKMKIDRSYKMKYKYFFKYLKYRK